MTAAATQTRLIDNYIAGAWTPAAAATGELDITNPATGQAIARVPLSGRADLDAAVAAARAALPEWRAVSTIARAVKWAVWPAFTSSIRRLPSIE